MNRLISIGWNERVAASFNNHAERGRIPARVASEHPGLYRVLTATGERLAVVSGKLRHAAFSRGDLPAVGDWVALSADSISADKAVVEAVLPRRSKFARQDPGGGGEQIVAANVDTVLIVAAANRDFNLRRLERYVGLAWASGAQPVVVVSKADLAEDADLLRVAAEGVAPGVPVHVLSVLADEGLGALAPYLLPGKTIALLGSSGAGKSTLFNALAGFQHQAVQAVRAADDRGRHTTTARELLALPCGAVAIDTPGMRELAMWDAAEGVGRTFEDVERVAASCRFHDCGHAGEPGCAVTAALDDGTLDPVRLDAWDKLRRELAYQARREDQRLALAEKQRWKKIHVAARQRGHR